jgi:hypothetical protein
VSRSRAQRFEHLASTHRACELRARGRYDFAKECTSPIKDWKLVTIASLIAESTQAPGSVLNLARPGDLTPWNKGPRQEVPHQLMNHYKIFTNLSLAARLFLKLVVRAFVKR